MITPAPALQPFSPEQKQKFLRLVSQGHKDDLALLMADIPQSHLSDLLASLPTHAYEEARLASKIPVAKVRQRLNRVMLAADDENDPMPVDVALDIMERQDPENWSRRTQIELKTPEPKLPPEEQLRLAKIFELPPSHPVIHEQGETTDPSPASGT